MALRIKCSVENVSNFQRAMSSFDAGVQLHVNRVLVSWAEEVKAEAKRVVPVKTGYLRSTIYAVVREWVVNVGADAAYALFVELGTRYMQARPYLYSAVQKYLPDLQNLIREAIVLAKREAASL
jgi:HK97 gp10 family phage protein